MSGLYIIYKCLNLFYYFISGIVIYLIYIDLMRKRCQLINVDVDVDVDVDEFSTFYLTSFSRLMRDAHNR